MNRAIPNGNEDITSEAYELLEMWCDKVKNDKERAKLSIKMMEFVDWMQKRNQTVELRSGS